MIIVYTGNGKGKTSASVGQAIRAYGQDMKVYFAQFMKSDQATGEQVFLKSLLKDNFYIGGIGFFTKEEQRPKHRSAVEKVLAWINTHVGNADMLILDESLYALKSGILTKEELTHIIEQCADKHLVLSGRGLPEWLTEKADIVSEINEIKHACHKGTPATKGIEF